MLASKIFFEQLEWAAEQLKKRGFDLDVPSVDLLARAYRDALQRTESLQMERNRASKKIGQLVSKGEDAAQVMQEVASLGESLKKAQNSLALLKEQWQNFLLSVPNLPDESVPMGSSELDNVQVRCWGDLPEWSFSAKDHVALTQQDLGIDFESAAKISGARFAVLNGGVAKLHRVLGQFMMDLHTKQHGYSEAYVPFLVNEQSMQGTGQLPKFSGDFFQVAQADLMLIPTGEVPLTNLYRDKIVSVKQLPVRRVAQTACFRSEAGAYGKDTRGMIRQHQFEKVELVQLVVAEEGEQALESLTAHAEKVLQLLQLPYRVVNLCTGDLGFGAAKTYDLEVWLPGQQQYREISSCSWCKDFQTRRMQARWRDPKTSKISLLHSINGSGLAIGRTLVAVLENYQQEDGRVRVPDVLQSYFDTPFVI